MIFSYHPQKEKHSTFHSPAEVPKSVGQKGRSHEVPTVHKNPFSPKRGCRGPQKSKMDYGPSCVQNIIITLDIEQYYLKWVFKYDLRIFVTLFSKMTIRDGGIL